jgi:hypothetical protein
MPWNYFPNWDFRFENKTSGIPDVEAAGNFFLDKGRLMNPRFSTDFLKYGFQRDLLQRTETHLLEFVGVGGIVKTSKTCRI